MTNSIYKNQGHNSSLLEEYPNDIEEPALTDERTLSIIDAGFLFSIELKREKLRNELESSFTFSHSYKELDFLSHHEDLNALLPSIGAFFAKEFTNNSALNLELMEEEYDWKTLFINIPVNEKSDWNYMNEIIDSFYDNMFDLYPAVMEKLNIDLVSYEL